MKKTFTILIAAIAAIMMMAQPGKVWAEDTTVTMTMTQYVSNNSCTVSSGNTVTCYTSLNLDSNLTMSTTGSANCGSFWGSTTQEWRLYQNKSGNVIITVDDGYQLKSVKLTFGASNSGILKDASNNTISSGTANTVSGSSVTYTVANSGNATNGQIKITAVEIKYTEAGGGGGGGSTTYTLNYSATNGQISGVDGNSQSVASGASLASNAEVTLTAHPDDNYVFSYWTVSGSGSTLTSRSTNPTTFKMGSANSTVTATFVSAASCLTTMDAIFSAATTAGSTATNCIITFNNWVVTGVKNNQAFVTDGTKGFIIYASNHGFAVGNVLSGTAACKVQLYNGAAEITTLTKDTPGLIVTTGGTVTSQVVAITDLSGVNTGALIQVNGVTYNGTYLVDGNSNQIKPYNTLYDGTMSFTNNQKYNVTGVYLQFNTTSNNTITETKEILPRSSADIVEVNDPTISASPASLTGFTYVEGHGPSTTQTVSVSGSNLTANISLSLGDNSNFEMCQTQNGTYTNSLTLTQSNGSVSATNVYVRLKSGLSKANNYAGTITLTSTDATDKTVSLSGSVTGQTYAIEQYSTPATAHGTITFDPTSPVEGGTEVTLTAEPAEGYDFTANSWVFYKESGNEIVEDNSITVTNGKITMPAYDLWVDATFAPKPTFAVTCTYDNTQGSLQADPTSAYEGQTVTLTYSESTNYELDAITLTHTEGGAAAQGVTLTKGEGSTYTFNMPGYAVTATATFVYTIFEGTFEPYTGDIVEGDYIIYGGTDGAMKNVISSNRFANSGNGDISISSNTITDPKKTVVWHIAKIGNTNYWSIYNARVNKYAGGTSTKNQGALYDDTDDDLTRWTITYDDGFVFYNYGRSQASSDNTNAYLRQNGSSGWGTYTSSYGNAPTLYKLAVATAPEWSTLPTPSILTNANYQLNLNELVSGTPAPTITVSTSATGYTLENGAFAFSTATAGTYEFTFRASNTAGYADATLTITVSAPQTFNVTVSTLNDNVNGINVYNTNDLNTPLIAGGAAGTVQVTEGTGIKVRPNVAAGYVLESLTINTTDVISEIDETGAYTFTMTGNVTISATAEFNPVVELTSTNISNMNNSGDGSYSIKTITVNGYYWEAKAYNTSNQKDYLQINTTSTNTNPKGSYIKLPVFNGKIETITCTVNTSDKILYFNTTNSASNPIVTQEDGTSATRTIDMSDVFYQTGYIVSSGTIQITNITVTYSPYQDMTGTSLPTTIANDQTVAIPSNTNATATDLTIPASSGVIIKSGAKLTVSGTLTNNGTANNIVIEDGGQLIYKDNGAKDAVQATVQKDIIGYGDGLDKWYFIASPITTSISPAAVTNLLGKQIDDDPVTYNYDLYRLNNTIWENYHQHNENADPFMLVNNKGYLYAKQTNTTLSFAGTIKPYDDTYEIPVSKGWNLVGNPYTFDAYVSEPYYAMEANGTGITAYDPTSVNTPVKPCTGIVIYADNDNPDPVAFSDQGPVTSANHGNIQVTLAQYVATRGGSNVETIDNAIVSFNKGTKLQKFYFGEPAANIYIPQDNEEYAIVSTEARGEMPVNFKAAKDGQYTITVNAEDVEMSYLHLIDNITGADVDLLNNPSYTFTGSTLDYASRFRLVFSANNNDETNAEMGDDFAFISNGQIILNGTVENATLQMIDMLGRVVSSQQINGNSAHMAPVTNGVYVLRLINNGESKTQKVVVK